jgi:hypothetical protein
MGLKVLKCFAWYRLASRRPFFLGLKCTEAVPRLQAGTQPAGRGLSYVAKGHGTPGKKMTTYGASLQLLQYFSVPKSYGMKSPLFPSKKRTTDFPRKLHGGYQDSARR